MIVLSLCDRTGNMVKPWADAGFKCFIVDIQHPAGETMFDKNITAVGADIRSWIPPRQNYCFVSAFPPCTHLAVSGARWFKEKGLKGLIEGLQLVEACRNICEWAGAPWLLENPVSTLASYWRTPDFTFHPYEYDSFSLTTSDRYYKRTCLWTGGGFTMPQPIDSPPDRDDPDAERIWKMGPSPERANLRSETPMGFAYAVFSHLNERGERDESRRHMEG